MFVSFALISLLAAVPKPPECTADSECVVSTHLCCPQCCPEAPHAVPKKKNEGAECAAMECGKGDCSKLTCARVQPASEYVAVCRAEKCVALPVVHPSACQVDSDCAAIVALPALGARKGTACSECPVTQAVSADAGVEPDDPSKPRQLSAGARTMNCPPCPPAKKASAKCQAGKCTLASP